MLVAVNVVLGACASGIYTRSRAAVDFFAFRSLSKRSCSLSSLPKLLPRGEPSSEPEDGRYMTTVGTSTGFSRPAVAGPIW